jgi:transcriptional regulator with XRE-family HTH domain
VLVYPALHAAADAHVEEGAGLVVPWRWIEQVRRCRPGPGQDLAAVRVLRWVTRERFCQRLGDLDILTLDAIERGIRRVSAAEQEWLAGAGLGITVSDLHRLADESMGRWWRWREQQLHAGAKTE